VSVQDTWPAAGTLAIVVAMVAIFYFQFLYTTLDEEMARINGVRTRFVNTLQLVLISLVIVVCGRMVGFLMITALTIPLFQLILFGFIDQTVKNVPTVVVDQDQTRQSRELLEMIEQGKIDTTFLISHRAPLEQAAEMYRHWHDEQEEVYFVHRGRLEMEFGDGTTHVLEEGGVGRVDPSTVRKLRNIHDGDTVYICFGGKDGYVGRDAHCFLKKDIKPPRRKPGFISGVVR